MKCLTCNIIEPFKSSAFTTHLDFTKTDALLNKLTESTKLNYEGNFTYLCLFCGTKWELSPPDNAYRGYLKKVSKRAQEIQELRRKLKT